MTGSIPPPGPLSYEGQVVVPYIRRNFDPIPSFNSFPIPTIWVNPADSTAWISVSKTTTDTDWVLIGGGAEGGLLPWTDVTTTTFQMVVNNGYVADGSGTCALTLPATCVFGGVVAVAGGSAGTLWRVSQNAGQQIMCGAQSTTSGTGGYIQATNSKDCIYLLCNVANTTFTAINWVGNLSIN